MKNNNIFLLVTFSVFIFCRSSFAQQPYFEWANVHGSSAEDIAFCTVVDSLGYVYVTGRFEGTVDFDPGPGIQNLIGSNWEIFLQKLDSDGNLVWVKKFGSTGSDSGRGLVLDQQNNLYLSGSYSGTVDFDSGPGVISLTSAGSTDIFVVKMDTAGNCIWARSAGGTALDIGLSVNVDPMGNVICGGFFGGTADFEPGAGITNLVSAGSDDAFVWKLDANGSFQWAKKIGGAGDDEAWSVCTDVSGNIYHTGWFEGMADLDPGAAIQNFTSAGQEEGYLQKLDPSGNLIWVYAFGDIDSDKGNWVERDIDGNILVTGFFSGTVDFDPGPMDFQLTSIGLTTSVFVQKLDPSGNFLWAKAIDGPGFEAGTCIRADDFANVYVSGNYQLTMDADPGPGIANLTAFAFGHDLFVEKFDANGDFEWAITLGDFHADKSWAHAVDLDGNVYTVGSFYHDTMDFDFGPGEYILGLSSSVTNLYVEKISQCTSTGNPLPDLTVLPDVISECAVTSFTIPTATHDCAGLVHGTPDVLLPITAIGTTVVTWTYNANYGSVSAQTQNITIIGDLTSPVPNVGSLSDLSHQCSVTPSAPSATDNCAGTLIGTPDMSFPITSPGVTVVTWTYDDGSGNTTTQTQNVEITGDIASPVPVISALPDLYASCELTPSAPTALDNCNGTIVATCLTPFPINQQGITTITWQYDDGNGNITTQQQDVIITDLLPPVPDSPILNDILGDCPLDYPAPTGIDACTGSVTAVPNVSFPLASPGVYNVTWTYEDANGNTFMQPQTFYIQDNLAPVPDDINLPDVYDKCIVTALPVPTATDLCSGTVYGINDITFPINTPGITIVTWTFDDGNGNTSTITQNIIIPDINTSVTQNGITLTADSSGYNYQWINCSTNTPITGETGQSYTAVVNGSYAVEMSDGVCNDTSDCFDITEVSISVDQLSTIIYIYPNPVSNELYIEQSSNSELIITICDASGQIVFTTTSSDIKTLVNMETFSSGTYLVSAINQDRIFTRLIVKS